MATEWCPQDATPPDPPGQLIGGVIGHLCHRGAQPWLVTSLMRVLLIHHFSAPSKAQEFDLRDLLWKAGPGTDILIEADDHWDPTLADRVPAVIVRQNAYASQRVGMNDQNHMPSATLQGVTAHAKLWVGSHTLFCVGFNGAQAKVLGSEIAHTLERLGPSIASLARLHRWQVMQMDAPGKLEEARERFAVPVTIGVAYMHQWKIEPMAPKIAQIRLSELLR